MATLLTPDLIVLTLSIFMFSYLLYALLFPEKF